jgi:uncharacterized membrane protein
MAIFYERTETEDKIVIKYKYWPLIYVLLVIGIVSMVVLRIIGYGYLSLPVTALCILLMLAVFFGYGKVRSEVREAMKKGKVSMSGSKFSFSNPYTLEIPKK